METTPNWDDLRYFAAVAAHGSLTAAARALGIEHTTVARRMDELEARLGARLFDRLPRGWKLTEGGAALVPLARQVEADVQTLLLAAQGNTGTAGTVRVSAPPAVAAWLLAPRLPQLLRAHPEIRLELAGESRQVDLLARGADIALRYTRPSAQGLAARRLTTFQYALYGSPGYLAAHPEERWEFLGYDRSLPAPPQQEWLERFAAGRRFALRANDQDMLIQAARAGAGLAVLPLPVAAAVDGLAPAPRAACPVTRPLWLVVHEDVRRAPRVRVVADLVASLFN
jgi:DNA-binding transcriptional LysR family regulator